MLSNVERLATRTRAASSVIDRYELSRVGYRALDDYLELI